MEATHDPSSHRPDRHGLVARHPLLLPATIEAVGKSGQLMVTNQHGYPVWTLPDQLRRKAPKA